MQNFLNVCRNQHIIISLVVKVVVSKLPDILLSV